MKGCQGHTAIPYLFVINLEKIVTTKLIKDLDFFVFVTLKKVGPEMGVFLHKAPEASFRFGALLGGI